MINMPNRINRSPGKRTLAISLLIASLATPLASEAQQAAAPTLIEQMAAARKLATGSPADREAALVRYGELLAEHPDNSDLLLARGRTLAWMDRWDESERDLLAVTSGHPDYADAWSALGDMYLWSSRPDKAAAAYGRWSALEPNEASPYIAQGRALRSAGKLQDAERAFQAAGERGTSAAEVESLIATLHPATLTPDTHVPDKFRWVASIGMDGTQWSGGRSSWSGQAASLRRRFDNGSLGLELLRTHAWDANDNAMALDGYYGLWNRAYGNLRYQFSPNHRLFPRYAVHAELFQGVGKGWELSGSYDRLQFSSGVDMYGLGVGKYFGNYYVRLRAVHVPGDNGANSTGYRLQVRNYYRGDADSFIELRGSYGRGYDYVPGVSQGLTGVSNRSVGVSWVYFPEPRWGFKVTADYGQDTTAPNARSASVTVYRRW